LYVHLDVETIRRKPWIGVLVFGGALVAFVWGTSQMVEQWRALRDLGAPREIALADVASAPAGSLPWVRITGGTWACAMAMEREHDLVSRWVLGRVDQTWVPIVDVGTGAAVVARFVGEIDCADPKAPVEGVVDAVHPWLYGSEVPPDIAAMFPNARVIHASESASRAWGFVLFGAGLSAASFGFLAWSLRLWATRRDDEALPAVAPPA
jgi:hypothetical protein